MSLNRPKIHTLKKLKKTDKKPRFFVFCEKQTHFPLLFSKLIIRSLDRGNLI